MLPRSGLLKLTALRVGLGNLLVNIKILKLTNKDVKIRLERYLFYQW